MNNYKIEITDTLQRTIDVEANSKEEAMNKVRQMYNNEDVVFDANDFVDVEFSDSL